MLGRIDKGNYKMKLDSAVKAAASKLAFMRAYVELRPLLWAMEILIMLREAKF